MSIYRSASRPKGLLILAVAEEQKQIGQELSTISDQLASGRATPQQIDQLSTRFNSLSKRFFALAALALSLSIATPAKAEDSLSTVRNDADRAFQELDRATKDHASKEDTERKINEKSENPKFYFKYQTDFSNAPTIAHLKDIALYLIASGKDPKTATLKECIPLLMKWVDSHVVWMEGMEELRPSAELIKTLRGSGAFLNNTVSANVPAIYYYLYQVEQTSCTGNSGGPGSCWVK